METQALTFTAAEVAQLTGVSPDQQRDWRRNGFIPPSLAGWTRYSLADLCKLALIRLFARQAIPPSASKAVVATLVEGLTARVLAVIEERLEPAIGDQTAVVWATGEILTYPSVQAAFDAATTEQQDGPCIVVDLTMIGTGFAIKVRDFVCSQAVQA